MSFLTLLKTSRPRFWIYLLGPALIGMISALSVNGQWTWAAIGILLVFTFPANLFIYGVNDVFDQETDRLNPKKQGYEQLLDPKKTRVLFFAIGASLIPFLGVLLMLPRSANISFLIFIFLGAFYSAPPIRAKAKPFLDALFNCLYLLPALVAWFAFGGGALHWPLVIAGGAWCMAMHAYSAVPDIAVDRASGIRTIATFLQKKGTLYFCTVLYLMSARIASFSIGNIALLFGLVYLVLMFVSLQAKTAEELFRVYRFFPWINTLIGMALFWWILLAK